MLFNRITPPMVLFITNNIIGIASLSLKRILTHHFALEDVLSCPVKPKYNAPYVANMNAIWEANILKPRT